MIYLRFSGTDTTLSHLFLPDLRPYTNRHDLRKKSLAAKKQHLRHQQKKRISGRKTLQKRCKPPQEHPSRHPPDTLPCMKTGQAGQPDNPTTRQPDKQPDSQTNRQTDRRRYTCGKPSDKYKGKNRYRKKKGKRKGKRSGAHVSHKRKRGSGEAAYGVFDRFFQLREADHQVPAISL